MPTALITTDTIEAEITITLTTTPGLRSPQQQRIMRDICRWHVKEFALLGVQAALHPASREQNRQAIALVRIGFGNLVNENTGSIVEKVSITLRYRPHALQQVFERDFTSTAALTTVER